MTIQDAFERLAKGYGTHTAAAVAMGYTPEHYRALRNGRYPIPERTEKAILDHAFDLGLHGPSSSLRASPSTPTEPEEVNHGLA